MNLLKLKNFFLVVFLCSVFASPFFINKAVDSDFLSFYYVGKGITEGKRMYADFSDNKGPVTYIFFSILYQMFKGDYTIALYISIIFFSALIVFLVQIWLPIGKVPKIDMLLFTLVNILMLDFIGSFTNRSSGVYSQTLGIAFVLLSLIFSYRSKLFFSGVAFILALSSRQTLVFYLVPLAYLICTSTLPVSSIRSFVSGCFFAFVMLGITVYILNVGFGSVFYNIVLHNLGYSLSQSLLDHLANTLFHSLSDMRVGTLLFLNILSLCFYVYKFFREKIVTLGLCLSVAGVCSTFLGGIFHSHLIIQTIPALSYFLFDLKIRYKTRVLSSLCLVLFFAYLSILFVHVFMANSLIKPTELIAEVITPYLPDYEYIQILGYYPEVYFLSGTDAPGRFFIPFFLSEKFNKKNREQLSLHALEMSPDVLEKTLFISPNISLWDAGFYEEYMSVFKEDFGLEFIEGSTSQVRLYRSLPK